MGNLLAIDWDYFFPNPLEGAASTGHDLLYDWGHREAPLFIDFIWPTRAMGFVGNGIPLPMVNDEWKQFLSRFRFTDDVQSYISESNMLAGGLYNTDGNPFESVWLFDTHHDSGYSYPTFAEWQASGQYSCEDWMLMHHQDGSELHVRHPAWLTIEPQKPSVKDVPLEQEIDDGDDFTDIMFDTVHLCRSGAWVPSWCDDQFFEFTQMLPGDLTEIGDYPLTVREYNEAEVRRLLDERKTAFAEMESLRGNA